jgi:hypothetical protein
LCAPKPGESERLWAQSAQASRAGKGDLEIKNVFKFFTEEVMHRVQLMANDNGISRVSQPVSIILGLILILG